MALSYFPNRIRTFPTHRNLLDDVDAAHINNIQAELHAVMTNLGTSPHIYNDLQVTDVPATNLPADDGGTVDDDTIFTTVLRYYDPAVKPVDHGTVAQRLDTLERGQSHWAFKMRGNNFDIASKSTILSERPRGIRFPKPNAAADPHGLFNGVGATLRKSGFWVFTGCVVYTLQGATAGSNNGVYQAAIDIDGDFLEGMDRDQITGVDKHPILKPVLAGWYNRGQRVSLRSSHDSGRSQKIRTARLTGFLLREVTG